MIKEALKKTALYRAYHNRKVSKQYEEEQRNNKTIRGPIIDKYFPKNGVGCELGVLQGNFSRVLLESTQAKELHLIDPWYFLDKNWHWAGGNTSTVDAVVKILNENKKEIEDRRVFVHVQDDLQVLNSFEDGYFDWAYIDSSHAYEHTCQELELLVKKVKSDGVIGGDDWQPDENHRHHGVYKAVVEFMEKYNYELIYADEENIQWFIRKATN